MDSSIVLNRTVNSEKVGEALKLNARPRIRMPDTVNIQTDGRQLKVCPTSIKINVSVAQVNIMGCHNICDR